ncbi:MAG: hypothetical protein LBT74_10525 [Acidobacteriota bacterium]|nr:hypothetical protein [Acidobacteriota bacterium]
MRDRTFKRTLTVAALAAGMSMGVGFAGALQADRPLVGAIFGWLSSSPSSEATAAVVSGAATGAATGAVVGAAAGTAAGMVVPGGGATASMGAFFGSVIGAACGAA